MLSVKVESVDFSGFDTMLSRRALDRVQLKLAEKVGTDCNRHVPKETGTLRGSMQIKPDEVSWNTDYAEYVYNMSGVNWTTPDTGGDWLEVTSRERLHDWEHLVATELLKEAE